MSADVWAAGKLRDPGVCEDCGRAKGWHDFWCPELGRFTLEAELDRQLRERENLDPGARRPVAGVTVVRKLSEVE